jgi:tetratricopeptide (TPR) repeat protein
VTTDAVQETAEAIRLARRAVELANNDAIALCFAGWAVAHVGGDHDTGAALIDKALALNPNLAAAWYCSGWVRVYLQISAASQALAGRALESDRAMTRLRKADPALSSSNVGSRLALRRREDVARLSEGLRKAGLPEGCRNGLFVGPPPSSRKLFRILSEGWWAVLGSNQ